jgi:environmental stress-induced protein Ves
LALAGIGTTIDRASTASPPAMHRLLTPADYVRKPWKNGGGTAIEIAMHPVGATLTTFVWRVSIADVTADGPFSLFPGVDRVIVLLSGAGMRIAGDAHAAELRAPFEPYAFSGDDVVSCSLVDGPVRDFNVMSRRGLARSQLVVVRDEAARVAPARWRVCHAVAGAVECLIPGHPPLAVAVDHTVVFEDDGETAVGALVVNPVSIGAVALVAAMEPVP